VPRPIASKETCRRWARAQRRVRLRAGLSARAFSLRAQNFRPARDPTPPHAGVVRCCEQQPRVGKKDQPGASHLNDASVSGMAASTCVERADLEAGATDGTEPEIAFRELQARDVIELRELQLALFPARQQAQSLLACSPRGLLERPDRQCLARPCRSALAARVQERGCGGALVPAQHRRVCLSHLGAVLRQLLRPALHRRALHRGGLYRARWRDRRGCLRAYRAARRRRATSPA